MFQMTAFCLLKQCSFLLYTILYKSFICPFLLQTLLYSTYASNKVIGKLMGRKFTILLLMLIIYRGAIHISCLDIFWMVWLSRPQIPLYFHWSSLHVTLITFTKCIVPLAAPATSPRQKLLPSISSFNYTLLYVT